MKRLSSAPVAVWAPLVLFLISMTLVSTVAAQENTWNIALRNTTGHEFAPADWIHDPQLKIFVEGTPFDAQFIDIDEDPAFSDPTTLDFVDPSGPPLLRTFEAPTRDDALQVVAFHPDGKTIDAGCSYNANVFFWDVATARKIVEFNESASPSLDDIAFLNGGSTFITWPNDGKNTHIFFYDYPFDGLSSRIPKTSIDLLSMPLYTCVPSPDGTKLLVSLGMYDELNPSVRKPVLRLYDAASKDILQTYDGTSESSAGLTDPIYRLAFSGDGKQFITISGDGDISLWDTDSGRILKEYFNRFPDVASVAFSPDGKTMLLGREDYYGNAIVQIVDVATGEAIHTLEGHTDTIYSLAYSPDGLEVLTASIDNTARLWDTQTGQLLENCQGHTASIYDVAFSPDGFSFVTASRDSTAKLWRGRPKYDYTIKNTADGLHTLYVRLRDGQGRSQTVSYDFYLNLAPADANWSIIIQDPEGDSRPEGNWINRTQMQVLVKGASIDAEEADFALDPGFTNPITQPLQEMLLSTSQQLEYHAWNYNVTQLSADWSKLVNYESNYFKICDFPNNTTLQGKTTVESGVRTVSFSPDASRLIVGLRGKSKLWNTVTGEKIDDDYLGSITIAAWSPDGTKVLYAGDGYDVKLADAQPKQLLQTFSLHTYTVTSLAFSPDGSQALSGSLDGRVVLWNTQTGGLIREIRANDVYSVSFSPDGSRYLAGGNSSIVTMWDVQTGDELQTFGPHFGIVGLVGFSPDGTKVLTHAGLAISVWDAATGQPLGSSAEFANAYYQIALSPDGTTLFNGNTHLVTPFQKYPVSLGDLADGSYTLYVRLRNRFGLSQINSTVINLDTVAPGKPGTPYNGVTPVPGGQAGFTWTPAPDNASGIHFYDYQVGTAPGATDVVAGRVGATDPVIVSVPNGVPVYCRVCAVDNAGNVGEWSDASAGVVVNTQPNIPGVVLSPAYPRSIDDVTARLVSGLLYTSHKIEWYLTPIPVQNSQPAFVGNTLKSSFLAKGQTWQCKISVQIPDGNFKYVYSKTFTVRDTPPSQPVVALSPRPAVAGQPLVISLVQASIDPDDDPIAYDIQWEQSTDGGQSWIPRADLDGMSEIPGGQINEGDRWRVTDTPYEEGTQPDRVEGLPGRDQVAVDGNQPPEFTFTAFQMQDVSGGVALSTQWTASDPEGAPVSVDLYYYDERYAMLTPLQLGIPAGQQLFSDILVLPRNVPIRLFAIASDNSGSVTQVSSDAVTLNSAVRPAWVLYQ